MADTRLFNFALPLADVAQVSASGRSIEPPVQTRATGAALECSRMGAEHVAGVIAARQRDQVLQALAAGPLNDGELEARTGISRQSLCGRRRELRLLGLIEKDDGRTRRNPRTGISNALWRLKA